MRRLLALLGALILATPALAQFPSPTFQALTVLSTGISDQGPLVVSGASTLTGGGTFSGIFAGPFSTTSTTVGFQTYTLSTLPVGPTVGTTVWVTDCLNGTQTIGFGTGCLFTANDNGVWTALPNLSTQTITVGGQSIFLGGATVNQGNGSAILTATPPFTVGDCLQVGAGGPAVDSGAPCGGGGGGSGTVTSAAQNSIPFYSVNPTGTTVAGLSIVNNAVLVTSGGGVPSESTTLPSALTIPSPTISNPSVTGTAAVSVANFSGKLTTAASAVGGAGLNVPQGTAPTVPANGDLWGTSAGLFGRFNGVTAGPYIGLTSLSATSPVSYNNSTGVFTCPNCTTISGGGAITATAPIVITGTAISLGTTIGVAEYFADATVVVHNDTYPLPMDTWPWATGTIDSITYDTGGTSTPAFVAAVQINGTPVTGCGVTVNSASRTTSTCTAANSITTGQHPTLVISGTSGSPSSSLVQINYHHSNP